MHRQKRYPLFILLLLLSTMLAILWLMSACAQPEIGSSQGSSSLTPLQVLQHSANTMKQLKSSHIELQSSNDIQVANASSTQNKNNAANNTSFSLKGSGDEALPDEEQLKLTINNSMTVAEIVQGDQVYIQNAQGKWYVLNKNDFSALVSNPFSGVTIDQNSLLTLIQHAQVTDHGKEQLNGQSLRHISAALDREGLRQLLQQNPQLTNGLIHQNININDYLNRAQAFQSGIDVWIDESKFYLHRIQLQLNITVDTTGVEGSAPSTTTTKMNTIVDLSKFNDPVNITLPNNATPTSNPTVIFGNARP